MAEFITCANKDLTPEQLIAALMTKNANGEWAFRTMEVSGCAENAIDCSNSSLPVNVLLAKAIGISECGKPALRLGKATKVLKVLVTQSGTSAPTLIVLENTTGTTFTPSYDGVGGYLITPADIDLFSNHNKVAIMIAQPAGAQHKADAIIDNDDLIAIGTYNAGSPTNGLLSKTLLTVEVFA